MFGGTRGCFGCISCQKLFRLSRKVDECEPLPGGSPRQLPFEGQSTMQAHYPAHDIPDSPSRVIPRPHTATVPFAATTTSQDTWVPHALPEQARRAPSRASPSPLKFDGTTTTVGRCRLTVSNPVLKASMVSAFGIYT